MKRLFPLLLCLFLPSCVEFQSSGGTAGAHYKGPPWGKVAYAKGDEMFTSDHDAGWGATVTAVQNLLTALGGAWIAGDVTKAMEITKQLKAQGVSNQVIAKTKADALTNVGLINNAKPLITTPPQVVTIPPK